MSLPRVSIRMLIVLVALVALDCLMLRWAWLGSESITFVNIIALPMVNILVVAASRPGMVRPGGRLRDDRAGFQVIGWSLLVATLFFAFSFPQGFVKFVRLFDPISRAWFETEAFRKADPESSTRLRIWWCAEISTLVSISTVCTIAQFLITRVGVWLASPRRDPKDR